MSLGGHMTETRDQQLWLTIVSSKSCNLSWVALYVESTCNCLCVCLLMWGWMDGWSWKSKTMMTYSTDIDYASNDRSRWNAGETWNVRLSMCVNPSIPPSVYPFIHSFKHPSLFVVSYENQNLFYNQMVEDGWLSGWMVECMHGWVDDWLDGLVSEQKDEFVIGWVDGLVNE